MSDSRSLQDKTSMIEWVVAIVLLVCTLPISGLVTLTGLSSTGSCGSSGFICNPETRNSLSLLPLAGWLTAVLMLIIGGSIYRAKGKDPLIWVIPSGVLLVISMIPVAIFITKH